MDKPSAVPPPDELSGVTLSATTKAFRAQQSKVPGQIAYECYAELKAAASTGAASIPTEWDWLTASDKLNWELTANAVVKNHVLTTRNRARGRA